MRPLLTTGERMAPKIETGVRHTSAPLAASKATSAALVSTSVVPTGMDTAAINGNLTIGTTTRPVTLSAQFIGAGTNPMTKKENVGFHATASIMRSDFGIKYALPMVSDRVDLDITVAFAK